MRKRVSGALGLAGLCAAALVAGTAPAASGAPSAGLSITPVLTGLSSPRGIAFDGQGSMYVSESGRAGAGAVGTTQTGRVSKYAWGTSTPAWQTAFTSYFDTNPLGNKETLGPEGVSAMGNGCMRMSTGQRNGCQVLVIMSESTAGIAHENGVSDPQAGHLYRLDGATGAVVADKSDVGAQMYAWTGAHSTLFTDFPDSNPFAVLVTKDAATDEIRTFVADAGANTISEVMRDGSLRVVAYIPNETFGAHRDATPTCIAQGPDGALYVGTLDLLSNFGAGGGASSVWRVDPNASYPTAPTVWASGLTTVTGCTFDRSGNFWASEMFGGSFAAGGAPGDVVTIPFDHPGQQTHVGAFNPANPAAFKLRLPGGIAQGPDGAVYVTTGSAIPAPAGAVVRIAG